jgi:uncharacterized protein YndB with AHSA1/START domain
MARNEISIDAPPERIFEVLSEPASFAEWVPGTREIADFDDAWPAEGTSFQYVAGLPGLGIRDRTFVRRSRSPVLLDLRIHGPFASTRATIELQAEGEGTRVRMLEEPAHLLLRLAIGPLGHALIKVRNVEALRRLKRLVEARN